MSLHLPAVPPALNGTAWRDSGTPAVQRAAPAALETGQPAPPRTRRSIPHPDLVVGVALLILGILSRIFTTNSLAGQPTTDEYLYGVHARDITHALLAGVGLTWSDVMGDGQTASLAAGLVSLAIPWDQITSGRAVQALFNALCIPATFLLGRQLGLSRWTSGAGALLLLAIPDFQEQAWRFWEDSQATLLGILYLLGIARWARRGSWWAAIGCLLALTLLFVTKESAFGTFAPLLIVPIFLRLTHRLRPGLVWVLAAVGLLMAAGLFFVSVSGPLTSRLEGLPGMSRALPLLQLAAPSVPSAVRGLPAFVQAGAGVFDPSAMSNGFLLAWTLGGAWLVICAVRTTLVARRAQLPWPSAVAWWVATLLWLLPMGIALASLAGPGAGWPWLLALAALMVVLVVASTRQLTPLTESAAPYLWLGAVAFAFFCQRLILVATPKLASGIGFTTRNFLPAFPALALLAAAGLWGLSVVVLAEVGGYGFAQMGVRPASAARAQLRRAVQCLARGQAPPLHSDSGGRGHMQEPGGAPLRARGEQRMAVARAALTTVAAIVLVVVWTPVLRERYSSQPLLGRPADRGADLTTAEGPRVEALVAAEPVLQSTIRDTDVVITGIPRQLAWYANLDSDASHRFIDIGSQPRTQAQRFAYVMPRVGVTGADFIVDFNIDWWDPSSDRATQWQKTFQWLGSRPNLEVVYVHRDRLGNPDLYVIGNRATAQGSSIPLGAPLPNPLPPREGEFSSSGGA